MWIHTLNSITPKNLHHCQLFFILFLFLAMANGHINTEIFWDSVNSQISIEGIFGQMFVSSDYSGATNLTRITLKFTIRVIQLASLSAVFNTFSAELKTWLNCFIHSKSSRPAKLELSTQIAKRYPMWMFHPINSLVVTGNRRLILLSKIWLFLNWVIITSKTFWFPNMCLSFL